MTVLILAAEFDVSADQMVLALRERGVPVCRVDTAWFPSQLSIDLECNSGGQFGWLESHTGAPLTHALADLLARGVYQ